MSSLIVEVCKIDCVAPHPDPETINLEIATVKGWECIVKKGSYKKGDKIVYIPIDSLIPIDWSEKWGVTGYLSKGRVKAAKIRQFVSCGLIVDCDDPTWKVGDDVAEYYGITKWEPPANDTKGQCEKFDPRFIKYTEIENLNNFTSAFDESDHVIFTEKIHGTNSRVGFINNEFMAGSHNTRRRLDLTPPKEQLLNKITYMLFKRKFIKCDYKYLNDSKDLYWLPLTNTNIRNLLLYLNELYNGKNIILFGEIYGHGVQDLTYDLKDKKDFLAFDITIDNKFLDWNLFRTYCSMHNVPIVPIVYDGPFNIEKVKELRTGKSMIASHMREGIVIRPEHEGFFNMKSQQGRKILKAINPEYLNRKNGTEFK